MCMYRCAELFNIVSRGWRCDWFTLAYIIYKKISKIDFFYYFVKVFNVGLITLPLETKGR